MAVAANVKQSARQLVEKLPDNATWDDLMYEIYVRQAIEAGIKDSDAGRTQDVKLVRARLGSDVLAVIHGAQRFPEEP